MSNLTLYSFRSILVSKGDDHVVRTIYHGSSHIIEKPIIGAGKPYNDYGLGFYCTDSLEMAKEWGVSKDVNGFANRYTIDCDGLTILNLNDPQFCILHWLTVLLENREFDASSALAYQAKEYLRAGQFAEGSMAPKVRAGIFFIENGGKTCIITEAGELSNPSCGTRIIQ